MLETSEFACIFVVEDNHIASPLPLEHTRVRAKVVGFTSVVTVEQQYRNTFDKPIDLEYLFPLNHEAAVISFELRVGGQVIKSSLQEIQQAKEQFERAKQTGKRAGIFELRLENLFAINLANVQPGEAIETIVAYQQKIAFITNQGEFIFPMGLTPKYHSQRDLSHRSGIDAPITFDKAHVGDIEIEVEVNPGVALTGFTSPTHQIVVEEVEAGKFIVELDGANIPDHDLVLRWGFAGESVQMPVWVESCLAKNSNERTFMATILPPNQTASANSTPREFVFVMDRSGSMSGEPILQAKNAMRACLRSMGERDTFAILLFDDRLETLAGIQPITQNSVDMVDRLLDNVDARGGTEISQALRASLTITPDPSRTRYVLFLTDGSVSGEASVIGTINQLLGNSRIFTFGIGPSVNRAFLTQLANMGKGMAEFIGANEDIEDAMLRFQDRVNFAQVTGISLMGEGGAIYDLTPARLPDLYSDSPLVVTGKFVLSSENPLSLLFRGKRGEEIIEINVPLTEACPVEGLVSRLNAKTIINDLIEKLELNLIPEHEVRPQVLQLAIANELASKYTAFIAVDETTMKDRTGAMKVNVAQPLPEGLRMAEMDMHYPSINPHSLHQMKSMPPNARGILFSAAPMEDFLDFENELHHFKMPAYGINEINNEGPIFSRNAKFQPYKSLTEFVREQKLNGSWEDDVEITSIILIHFVRAGYSTKDGMYRTQLIKAVTWLLSQISSGKHMFILCSALSILWEKTQDQSLKKNLDYLVSTLPTPSSEVERMILLNLQKKPLPKPSLASIESREDLYIFFVVDQKGVITDKDLMSDKLNRVLAYGRS